MKRVEDLIAELQALPAESPVFIGETGEVVLRYDPTFGEVHIPYFCEHEHF